MKRLLIAMVGVTLIGCATPESDNEPVQEPVAEEITGPSLEGTWEMTHYYFYDNNEITDTVMMSDGYRQVKMYQDGHVMWSRQQPKDSTQLFGYGIYMIDGESFIENMEFGSHYMMNVLDSNRIFNWVLDIGDDYYIQTEVSDEGERIYSETYRRLD